MTKSTPKKDTAKMEFYYWVYDDGTEAGATINSSTRTLTQAHTFCDNTKRETCWNKLEAKHPKSKCRKIKLECGLKQIRVVQNSSSNSNHIVKVGMESFLQMLEACGQDISGRAEVMKLVSSLLSAYYSRFLFKHELLPAEDVNYFRAPIVVCNIKDGVYDLLTRVVQSISVNTQVPWDDNLRYSQPSCLPQLPSKDTLSSAFVQLKKGKGKYYDSKYPAQYRDTAVFLKANVLSLSDLQKFQRRNPWAVLVLLGATKQAYITDPIQLDSSIIARYLNESDWDIDHVNEMITHFAIWSRERLHDKSLRQNYKELIHFYNKSISKHNRMRGTYKVRGLQKLWLEIQLLAICEFIEFGVSHKCWSKAESETLLAEWNTLLLPTIFPHPQPIKDLSAPGRPIVPQFDCRNLFEQVLSEMTSQSYWKHFVYVSAKSEFPVRSTNVDIWGYIRTYQDKTAHQRILTLQIREETFNVVAKKLGQNSYDWYDIVKCLRQEMPSYLHTSKTTRMPGIGPGEKTLILKVDQLAFLPHNTISMILSAWYFNTNG